MTAESGELYQKVLGIFSALKEEWSFIDEPKIAGIDHSAVFAGQTLGAKLLVCVSGENLSLEAYEAQCRALDDSAKDEKVIGAAVFTLRGVPTASFIFRKEGGFKMFIHQDLAQEYAALPDIEKLLRA